MDGIGSAASHGGRGGALRSHGGGGPGVGVGVKISFLQKKRSGHRRRGPERSFIGSIIIPADAGAPAEEPSGQGVGHQNTQRDGAGQL